MFEVTWKRIRSPVWNVYLLLTFKNFPSRFNSIQYWMPVLSFCAGFSICSKNKPLAPASAALDGREQANVTARDAANARMLLSFIVLVLSLIPERFLSRDARFSYW